ncbi:response regulator transcription factor [Alkalibacter saccharofermentans]|uniref:Stage 0 sporulation protein A homolog n=1 Tax=Alkalibacter saccharofermentans DSM 14828 TaxID=1120975 RepID=A0A1M4SRY1_9FIRM|nr:helix-turn-helix domain-containing protein [Alkalibacter saccharofermentans]SHE34959.1 Response regulator receiver domain-containing protein [Alkalibacter saccharofermentans DSM 14828]
MYKILLTDDEILEREGLKIIIKEVLNSQVLFKEANSGKEAIRLSDAFEPHIIFMDIKMPGLNGIEASQYIKNKHPDIIIIILSAYDDFQLAQQAIRLGVNDYILKPPKPTEINLILHKYIKQINSRDAFSKTVEPFPPCEEKDSTEIQKHSSIQIVLDYIDNNLGDNMPLEDAAKLLNVSPSYFSRLFKKEMGVKFITYTTNRKIEKAKAWLETTDMPILNIALELGFKEANYFSKVFRKLEGITPTEYRKRNSKLPL